MKKLLLSLSLLLINGALFSQEVITGWDFPANAGPDSLNANMGLTGNKGYDIRLQMALTPTSDSTINSIYFADGPSSYAAATANWDNGADSKFWSIKFKANNYSDFKVSSKQKSDAANAGPRDFKLQWRLSSGTYADVANGAVTVGSDWTTGVVTDLPVPITGQGTGSIYIRWIMASNTDVNGGTVAATGISMIDDIVVTAQGATGQQEVIFNSALTIFPSPNSGSFTVRTQAPASTLTVTDLNGRVIFSMDNPAADQQVGLRNVKPGMYILKAGVRGDEKELTTRFVIE